MQQPLIEQQTDVRKEAKIKFQTVNTFMGEAILLHIYQTSFFSSVPPFSNVLGNVGLWIFKV